MFISRRKADMGDMVIDAFVYVFLFAIALVALLPLANVFSKSISAEWAVISGKVGILPVDFQLDTMKKVVTEAQFVTSFKVSLLLTIVGTLLSLAVTAITAYPLSKKAIPGVKFVLVLFVFTMLFNGGIIPNYLLVRNLGLMNNFWSLILPGLMSTFNMLVMKSFYESLPESLEESARIDGASYLRILFQIIIPLSKPVMATVCLFYTVSYWNDFFNAMLYISKPALKPLQLHLRDIIVDAANSSAMTKSFEEMENMSPEGVRSASIVASTVPMLIVYPFLQRYFIKGIMIGSVKG